MRQVSFQTALPGGIVLALLLLLQAGYGWYWCAGQLLPLLLAGGVLLLPALGLLFTAQPQTTMTAVAILVPFVAMGNSAECSPGSGVAAFGYLPGLLFGWPLAIGLATFLQRDEKPDES